MHFGLPRPTFSLISIYVRNIFLPKPTYSKPLVRRARKEKSATISCEEICHSWGAFKSCRKWPGHIHVLLTSVSHADISLRNAQFVISPSSLNSQSLSFSVRQVRLGKWDEALEMLGEVNPFRGEANEPRELYLYASTSRCLSRDACDSPLCYPRHPWGYKGKVAVIVYSHDSLTFSHRSNRPCATCEE